VPPFSYLDGNIRDRFIKIKRPLQQNRMMILQVLPETAKINVLNFV